MVGRPLRLRALVLACGLASGCFGQEANDDGRHWELAAELTLAPGASRIAVLEQVDSNLLLRISTAEGSLVQNSARFAFGYEVALLQNDTAQPRTYRLEVAPVLEQAYQPRHRLQLLEGSPPEDETALVLMEAARRFHDASFGASELTRLAAIAESSGGALQAQARLQYLQALLGITDYQEALAGLARWEAADAASANPTYAAHWQLLRVECLLQLRRLEEARAVLATLAPYLETTPLEQSGISVHMIEAIRGITGGALNILGATSGDPELSQEGFALISQAIENAAPLGNYDLLGLLYNYAYGYHLMNAGRTSPAAFEALQQASRYYSLAGASTSLAAIKNNLANGYLGLGEIGLAQAEYRQALQLGAGEDAAYLRGHILGRLAFTYFLTGDYERAETYYRESIEVLQALGLFNQAVNNEIELGLVLHERGKHAEAIAHFEALLAEAQRQGWREYLMRIHLELAGNHFDRGDLEAAQRHLLLARASPGTFSSRPAPLLEMQLMSARLLFASGAAEQAEVELRELLRRFSSPTQDVEQQLAALTLLASVQHASGRGEEALRTSREALGLIDFVWNQLEVEQQGPAWNARTREARGAFISRLLNAYMDGGPREHLEEALSVLERFRGRALREQRLVSTLAQDDGTDDSPGLLALREQLRVSKRALLNASLGESGLREQLRQQYFLSEEDYLRALEVELPSGSGAGDSPTLRDIQGALEPGEAALLFHLADADSHRLLITADAVLVERLAPLATLQAQVAEFLSALGSPRGRYREVAAGLRAQLLPALPAGVDTLIVAADGVLTQLPLAGLFADLPPGSQPAILNVASLADFRPEVPIQAREDGDRLALALIADPRFSRDESVDEQAADFLRWREGLEALPHTAREAEEIARLYAESGEGRVALALGREATLERVLNSDARRARILHIGTHGYSDPTARGLNGLVLAASPDDPASGLLTPDDLTLYHFDNELVVISGCETGQGLLLEGEGIMSLARAFLASGAKAALASLWPVSDRASALFMGRFYRALLQERATPAQALRAAQALLQADPQYRHPFYWSAFQLLMADPRSRPAS